MRRIISFGSDEGFANPRQAGGTRSVQFANCLTK